LRFGRISVEGIVQPRIAETDFLPRDAMLALYVYVMAPFSSVRLCVRYKSDSVKTAKQIIT